MDNNNIIIYIIYEYSLHTCPPISVGTDIPAFPGRNCSL